MSGSGNCAGGVPVTPPTTPAARLCVCGHHPAVGDGCPVLDCDCTGYTPQLAGPQTGRVVQHLEVCDDCGPRIEATVRTLVAERDAARRVAVHGERHLDAITATARTEVGRLTTERDAATAAHRRIDDAMAEVDAALAEWAIAREEVPAEQWRQVAAMWDDLQAALAERERMGTELRGQREAAQAEIKRVLRVTDGVVADVMAERDAIRAELAEIHALVDGYGQGRRQPFDRQALASAVIRTVDHHRAAVMGEEASRG